LGRGEEPAGSNTSELIKEWFEPAVRLKTKKLLGLTGGNWCAVFACAAMQASLEEGEESPHNYLASGLELELDARVSGRWHMVDEIWLGHFCPQPGDVCIFDRSQEGHPDSSWLRHVGRVIYYNPKSGKMVTIEGNSENAVRIKHHLIDRRSKLLGIISYQEQVKLPLGSFVAGIVLGVFAPLAALGAHMALR
jgi:hypothetical protein